MGTGWQLSTRRLHQVAQTVDDMTKVLSDLKASTNGNGAAKAQPKDLLQFIKRTGVKMVDFKFTDVPGTWQHTTVPADQIDTDALTEGIGFDGSSIRGFQSIHESDMLLMPDLHTAQLDAFC